MVTLVNHALEFTHARTIRLRDLWTRLSAVFASLTREVHAQRRKVYVSSISNEWLRCYAVESVKHLDDG